MHIVNMVHFLPKVSVDKCLCAICIMGKQHREKLEKKYWRAKEKLGIVQTDICGPILLFHLVERNALQFYG
jgi:hypothetical protein